jgi:hypothetical protein
MIGQTIEALHGGQTARLGKNICESDIRRKLPRGSNEGGSNGTG